MGHPPIDQQITFLYTPDLAEAAHFYEDIMGLSLQLDQGQCRIYKVGRDAFIGFCQSKDAASRMSEPGACRVILTLVSPDVDAWYRYLSEHGVAFEKPPVVNPDYSIYHCFLRDPDGNLIEIQRFLHPF